MGKRKPVAREFREACRKALLARRAEILGHLGVQLEAGDAGGLQEDDQAQMVHDEFISSRLSYFDCENLHLVETALERLDSDEFGFCAGCGRPIPEQRLAAVPWAQRCVSCQETIGKVAALVQPEDAERAAE